MVSQAARLWRNRRSVVVAVAVLAAIALAVAVIWPFTDLIAAHDVGTITGSQRALHLQSAREAVRTQLLTFFAGLFAFGALVFTAWNVTLYRQNLGLYHRTNELTEQGQLTDRYTKAIEQLGTRKKLDVRLGGIYALERIARDSPRDHPTVMEVLAAFIRDHSHKELPEPVSSTDMPRRLRADVQAAITVIGRRETAHDRERIDLRCVNLPHAHLRKAKLSGADLGGANLTGADLGGAHLDGANLELAVLGAADLPGAILAGANLSDAIFTGAYLDRDPQACGPPRHGLQQREPRQRRPDRREA